MDPFLRAGEIRNLDPMAFGCPNRRPSQYPDLYIPHFLYQRRRFSRMDPHLYHKFENMVIFGQETYIHFVAHGRPGNQHYQKIIHF